MRLLLIVRPSQVCMCEETKQKNRAADSALQFLNEYFCTLAHAGLAGEEQPERVKQLANLLAFFLREDFSDSHKSLDGLGQA